ncbi:MAG TPA: VWA domain-containing protein [Candidatus Limnocylindria bacterium]|nr:VWA domain-containing protein [Candidatus Limnocylindria bacterium]
MNFQFTHPAYLLALLPALAWVLWLFWKTDVQIGTFRRWVALVLRVVIVSALVLAIAGLQWKQPLEGVNVMFVLDRSDSIPSPQQEAAFKYAQRIAGEKKKEDRLGYLVFGSDAALETTVNSTVDPKKEKIFAVVGSDRTDIAGAIRLGTAAFPETGQKRLVLLSDGNENMGDALNAVLSAKPLGVSIDVVPLGVARGNDVSLQRMGLPSRVKKGQTIEAKIFVQSDRKQKGRLRLYRDEQFLGEQEVDLEPGKNLFTFPQTLNDPKFYTYSVQVDVQGDNIPQNNRATAFVNVRGDPRILLVTADAQQDATLAAALRSANIELQVIGVDKFPESLAQLQSYDSIFISNIAAGDLGDRLMKLLESAVRDFGVGLVCVGGDQTYMAGAYKGTPLEATLPVNMELDSKKVLPPGAVVLVMHGMEFGNGNQVARDCAQGVLAALGPQDELGVVMWDGTERWVFELQKVGNKKEASRAVAGMNQGDLPSFEGVMSKGYNALKKSTASLKHMIVFSDGDPGAPSQQLMSDMVAAKITVSSVLISGHAGPQTMQFIADQGRGRFHNVISPNDLPQIFIKETMVILKSAIYEEPFRPKLVAASELVRGIGAGEYPTLHGYVSTQPKARAEVPLLSEKGDPILAHWQYGLGRAVAFTSDAKPKWARMWMNWDKYRQFWSQTAQWSLRRVENADFTTEVNIDKGEGVLSVEALDEQGNFRNFLNLQTVVVSPKGDRQMVRLEQTGPGHYEARFPTKEIGGYSLNLMDVRDGKVAGQQFLGASVNYSPEFNATEPNRHLLQQIAEASGGKMLPLQPTTQEKNPFLHDRKKTFQPRDLWEFLLKLAICLFPLDVGVRRIQLDRDEWLKATATLRRWIFFWRGRPRPVEADESLGALLARRDQVRSTQTGPPVRPAPELFQPTRPVDLGTPLPDREAVKAAVEIAAEQGSKKTEPPAGTTSRLLEAKRRAQKRNE